MSIVIEIPQIYLNMSKSFELLEGSANDDFCTDYLEMHFEISDTGSINFETNHFWFTFENRFSLNEHEKFPNYK